MKKKLWASLLLGMMCLTVAVAKPKEAPKGVYMYGIATSLADSTLYVTNIMYVENAQIDEKTKFLDGRNMYSEQLRYYMEGTHKGEHMTCGVQFDIQKHKLQKQYQRFLSRARRKKHLKVNMLPNGAFEFTTLDIQEVNATETN